MSAITWTNTTVKLGDLQPWARNPRKSSKKQAAKMLESWDRFGQVQTIAVSPSLQVLDGHQRLSALLTVYGKNYIIDARQASRELSEQEREQLVVTLHTGAMGSWDWGSLANWNADSLQAYGFDSDALSQWSQDASNLALLLESEKAEVTDPGPQIDRAEELRGKWSTKPGQMWSLDSGKGHAHRLICGDCTDRAVVERVMGGERADMVFTDPPYNVSYQTNESTESLKARNRRTDGLIVQNDTMTDEEFDRFLGSFLIQLPLKSGGAYYLCAPAGRTETQFRTALDRAPGLALRQCIVWVKDQFVFGRQDYHWRHESILYGWKEGESHYFVGDRTQDTVWQIPRPKTSEFHPTTKPIELPSKAIANSSKPGGIVYEPFNGSGSTLIACEQLSRRCRAIEISPAYTAVALQRFFDLTGIEPTLIE